MKRAGGWLVVAVVLGSRAVAAGDGNAHTHMALPTFKLEGGPGKSSLDIGVDIALGLDPVTDLRLTPKLKATASDGITTILSSDGSSFVAGSSWQLGIAATITDLHRVAQQPVELVPRERRLAAMEICRNECDRKNSGEFCSQLAASRKAENAALEGLEKQATETRRAAQDALAKRKKPDSKLENSAAEADQRFKTARSQTDERVLAKLLEEFDPAKLCTAGQEPHLQAEREAREARDGSLQLPHRQWSGGVAVGQTRNKWLEPATSDPMLFHIASKDYPQVTLAGSYVAIEPGSSFTTEASLRLDSSWQSPGKTAKWCTPAGTVSRPDGGMTDQAQSCDEQPLGHPTVTRSLRAAGYIGLIDSRTADWRVAFGPTLKYVPVDKADNAYEVGIDIPIYVRISLLKQATSAVLRLSPAFTFKHASDGKDSTQFTVTLAVLGDRSMFANALE